MGQPRIAKDPTKKWTVLGVGGQKGDSRMPAAHQAHSVARSILCAWRPSLQPLRHCFTRVHSQIPVLLSRSPLNDGGTGRQWEGPGVVDIVATFSSLLSLAYGLRQCHRRVHLQTDRAARANLVLIQSCCGVLKIRRWLTESKQGG